MENIFTNLKFIFHFVKVFIFLQEAFMLQESAIIHWPSSYIEQRVEATHVSYYLDWWDSSEGICF